MVPILIVDDDELLREGLCALLQKNGYFCKAVENGAKAVEWVLSHDVDVVITDYQMPEMSGLEFLDCLHHLPIPLSLPVIFMTGNSSEALRQKAKQAGAYTVLLKPFDTDDLLQRVQEALAFQRSQRQCVLL